MILLSIKDKLISELGKSFDPKINFNKRINVLSDLTIFKPKEDISVWRQKRGDLPEYFTVYFDGEYICGFDANQPVEKAILEFWKGFKEAYKSAKIRLIPTKTEETKPTKQKEVLPATKEEKMAAEIVKKLNAK